MPPSTTQPMHTQAQVVERARTAWAPHGAVIVINTTSATDDSHIMRHVEATAPWLTRFIAIPPNTHAPSNPTCNLLADEKTYAALLEETKNRCILAIYNTYAQQFRRQ